ncbi:dual oxidase maturation factor 1 isoform X1 [Leuresthes tenuis]|uniref:dual oxidase maturation factor 1 isoform X1 n=1 Tax=Leuresthes tenuis TaxID=355514 RepID=UPI003B505052
MTFYYDIYPFYTLQRTSFIISGRLLTIILVFLVLAVSLLLILPGIRGKSRLFWMLRIITSLFIGVVIVVLNFTNNWAEARITTNATYKSFSNAVINADVGLHVGLYGINVTLRGNPIVQHNETINYNEMFNWHDTIEEEYEGALEKGLPNPILYIAEKFTLGSPCGLIFQYRYSGRYASATLCILLLDARQHPLHHSGHSVCRVYDDGHRCLHFLLHGLLLHNHECTSVCFLHRSGPFCDRVQPFILAGPGNRCAVHRHWDSCGDFKLSDAREDKRSFQCQCGQL